MGVATLSCKRTGGPGVAYIPTGAVNASQQHFGKHKYALYVLHHATEDATIVNDPPGYEPLDAAIGLCIVMKPMECARTMPTTLFLIMFG